MCCTRPNCAKSAHVFARTHAKTRRRARESKREREEARDGARGSEKGDTAREIARASKQAGEGDRHARASDVAGESTKHTANRIATHTWYPAVVAERVRHGRWWGGGSGAGQLGLRGGMHPQSLNLEAPEYSGESQPLHLK